MKQAILYLIIIFAIMLLLFAVTVLLNKANAELPDTWRWIRVGGYNDDSFIIRFGPDEYGVVCYREVREKSDRGAVNNGLPESVAVAVGLSCVKVR